MSNRYIKIKLINGMEIVIPKYKVDEIKLPSVEIKRNMFRLRLNMQDWNKELEKLKRKYRL